MALVLTITDLKEFYDMINFACKPCYIELDFPCTRTYFALAVSHPSPQGRCFVELQLQAQYFPNYATTSANIPLIHRAISPQQFFIIFHAMTRSGFDYAILTLALHHHSLKFYFYNISDLDRLDLPYHLNVPFLPTIQRLDPNRTNSTAFVSFPQFPLESMLATLTALNNKDSDHFTFIVTLTTFESKFTAIDHMGRDVGFILSVEKKECVIQDVAQGQMTQIVIVLNPLETFKNIMSLPNLENYLVVVGKSSNNNNNRGIVIINRGLHARYFFYSTE